MSDRPPSKPLPERNPLTHLTHKQEVFWQITFPLILGVLLLSLACVGVILTATGTSPDINRWADISTIWLLLPLIFGTVIVILALTGMVYVLVKILAIVPGYARLMQDFFTKVQVRVRILADKIVEPVLKIQAIQAGARVLKHEIFARRRDKVPPET
jgi:hypothetical protein